LKFPVLSYTLLNTWEICPHQCARKYIVKDLPREAPTGAMKEGIDGHEALEKRLRNKTPLPARHEKHAAPLDQCTVTPEQKLGVTAAGRPCDFFDKDVWLRGVLDAPVLLRTDAACLIDWKFGKPREHPFELEIGALLLQAHRPEITYLVGAYIWLKEGRKGETHVLSDTSRTWAKVQNLADEIADAIDAQEFKKTPGPLCGWCPVKDCQHNKRAA
jgi:PD-(D/E)XK nuclease superfamily